VTGAAYENDRLAKSVVSLGTVSRGSAADRV